MDSDSEAGSIVEVSSVTRSELLNQLNQDTPCIPTCTPRLIKQRRNFSRDEFINIHLEEISNIYMALKDYLEQYCYPLLQHMDFQSFGTFCYHNSLRTRRV